MSPLLPAHACSRCHTRPTAGDDPLCLQCRAQWWAQLVQHIQTHMASSPVADVARPTCSRCDHPRSIGSRYCAVHTVMWLRARRYAIRWARHLLDRCYRRDDWVILDTETTGLDDQAELIEIAIISPYGLPLLNTRVRPMQPIPTEATAVHHITNAMVADAPLFPDVYSALAAVLEGRTVIVYNAQFDRRILAQTQTRYGCAPLPPVRWACAMRQHARYAGQWNAERRDYRWPRLHGGDHSALGDCYATLRLLHFIAANAMTKV